MAIQRWEPFREMISLREAVNSLLQDSFVRPADHEGDGNAAMLPLDITENENEFLVKASLPGVRPEDVQITARGDTLTIRGEMKAEEEKKDDRYHLRERRYRPVSAHGGPPDPDQRRSGPRPSSRTAC